MSWLVKNSVICRFCGELTDERKCMPADEFSNYDGGSICLECLNSKGPAHIYCFHGGEMGKHPIHSLKNWKSQVSNNKTRLGYWEWVLERIKEK